MPEPTYALITGASSGIGECFARALAARQRNLVLVARSADRLEALAAELRSHHGILAEPLPSDLAASGAAAALAARLGEKRLSVDLLVNNAGFGARGEFLKLPLDRQSEMVDLNVRALIELTHFLARPMMERRAGAIINVASTASFQAVPYTTLYSATKALVLSFSLGLAEELRPYSVTVVTLCPGGTQTNFFKASGYGRPNMLGSLQLPEEVAAAGLRALERGGGLVVPRLLNKAMVFVQRLVPRGLPVKMAARMFRP
ncbi:MAG TPA: SDR family oxidoreductase [Terriglobia bacterium]|nr:SDR family oxidoreductase [Terriglobia bacterium]